MKFYTGQHRFFRGIDLRARSMLLCILDSQGNVLVHKNIKATLEALLSSVTPYREDLAVAVRYISLLVLARRSLRPGEDPLRPRARAPYEGHPRR